MESKNGWEPLGSTLDSKGFVKAISFLSSLPGFFFIYHHTDNCKEVRFTKFGKRCRCSLQLQLRNSDKALKVGPFLVCYVFVTHSVAQSLFNHPTVYTVLVNF